MFKMTRNILLNLVGPRATRRYPVVVRPAFDNCRGEPVNDMEKCTLCGTCAVKCPSGCILVDKRDRRAERLARFGNGFAGPCEALMGLSFDFVNFSVGVATPAGSSRISTVSDAILTPARVRKSKVVWTGPFLSRGSVITRLSRSPNATAQSLEADPGADTSAPADRRLDGGRPDNTTEPSGSKSGSARSACCSTDAVATRADRRSGSGRDGGRGSKASIAGRSQSRARELTSVYGSSGSAMSGSDGVIAFRCSATEVTGSIDNMNQPHSAASTPPRRTSSVSLARPLKNPLQDPSDTTTAVGRGRGPESEAGPECGRGMEMRRLIRVPSRSARGIG